MMQEPKRILVVKLGALGNVILSLGPFASIRHHHADAHITLLTTAPFAPWLGQSPWFDTVWTDRRLDWWDLPGWLRLRRRLIDGRFDRIYDLQTSRHTGRYFRLLPRRHRPDWSGIAPGCSLPDRDPNRDRLHDADRQFGQLRQAGITEREPVNLSWSDAGTLLVRPSPTLRSSRPRQRAPSSAQALADRSIPRPSRHAFGTWSDTRRGGHAA